MNQTLANYLMPSMQENFTAHKSDKQTKLDLPWPTFAEILYNLHKEGFYICAEQLAEFMLLHGLPVDLQYVPLNLQEKAKILNSNYQGDMVRLSEKPDDYSWYISNLELM